MLPSRQRGVADKSSQPLPPESDLYAKDEPSNCLACRQVARSLDYDSLSASRDHRSIAYLGRAIEFPNRLSCATCRAVWNLAQLQACPRLQAISGRRVPLAGSGLCPRCSIRLDYTKEVPHEYGYHLVLDVSRLLAPQTNQPLVFKSSTDMWL